MGTQRRIQRKIYNIKRIHKDIERMRHKRLEMPFVKFVMLMPYFTDTTLETLFIVPPPKVFCKVAIPDTLQMVTFGTLTRLQQAPTEGNYLKSCCDIVSVLTGIDAEKVAMNPAIEVLGIVNMVQSEMKRIGKLFASLNAEKTSDELAAGIEGLNYGAFGIVDWYAKRMGIVDHEEVFATPWARIFQCMKIDHETNEFEKRYRKIVENRSKRK